MIARKIHLLDFKYSLTLNAMIANSQELGLKQFIVPEAKWRDYGFCVKSWKHEGSLFRTIRSGPSQYKNKIELLQFPIDSFKQKFLTYNYHIRSLLFVVLFDVNYWSVSVHSETSFFPSIWKTVYLYNLTAVTFSPFKNSVQEAE